MVLITEATIQDFDIIREIAHKTWPTTYGEILSTEQLEYMLDKMYSDETLIDNFKNKGHRFLLIKEKGTYLGFASYEHSYLNEKCTRLHKIYILPETQGRGLGKLLIHKLIILSKENNSNTISLNVNRFNKAYAFYKKMGFEIIAEEDLDIGDGYLMEDFILEKKLI